MNTLTTGHIVAIVIIVLLLVLTFRKFKKRAGARRKSVDLYMAQF